MTAKKTDAKPEAADDKAAEAKPAAKKDTPKEVAASTGDRLDALEKEVGDLRKLMQRNGWTC